MSNNKDHEQEHIPTSNKEEEEEKGSSGTGGLLSAIGDPAGMLPSAFYAVLLLAPRGPMPWINMNTRQGPRYSPPAHWGAS
jgi:hypothetical protein